MKGGYTLSWRWIIGAGASLIVAIVCHVVFTAQLESSEQKLTERNNQVGNVEKEFGQYATFTGAKLDEIRTRVDAVSKRLVPADRAENWAWLGREWNTNVLRSESSKEPAGITSGYERQIISVERIGSSNMTDWGVIVTRMGEWESTPGLCLRGVDIRANGNEAGRFFEKIAFTMDVYFAKNK